MTGKRHVSLRYSGAVPYNVRHSVFSRRRCKSFLIRKASFYRHCPKQWRFSYEQTTTYDLTPCTTRQYRWTRYSIIMLTRQLSIPSWPYEHMCESWCFCCRLLTSCINGCGSWPHKISWSIPTCISTSINGIQLIAASTLYRSSAMDI